ncbi:MAG: [Fe-Fe] hydrogenase large subunit C-terminal domain-containing protein, partial [Fibrobacter sp.]|nr:[Fe-Fe] hydrogenase large subunit C-terminal domain-containing protein [Fibrobacter sp.]
QQVSAHAYHQLSLQTGKTIISSACPVVVDYITRFFPEFTSSLTNLLSPMLAHCKMLHKKYGSKIGILFIGPCIAKKREADSHPYLIDCVLTFSELRAWLKEANINPALIDPDPEEHKFVPSKAEEGALYPVDGGMVATLKANCAIHDSCFMSFSGLHNIKKALEGLRDAQIEGNIFIEALACEGGCINGPKSFHRCETALKRFSIVKYSRYPQKKIPRRPSIPILEYITDTPVEQKVFTEQEIIEALHQVGKYTKSDELNCGGCGYDSCRDFAKALLSEKAERAMCVTYMRKLAHNKANGLLRTMPSGVVIVDEELKIIECNRNFTKLFGNDIEMIFEQNPGIQGAFLRKIVPFYEQFRHVLNENHDLISKDFHVNNRVLHGSIFTIEPHHVVGGVFADITAPAIQKEQIVNRAQDVIQKNLKMVQQIAYLLGENASESEAVLSSIIESFSNSDPNSDKSNGV